LKELLMQILAAVGAIIALGALARDKERKNE
jgi:hypothetical protein